MTARMRNGRPVEGRPDWRAVALVHLVLCDRARRIDGTDGARFVASESVEQIAAATGLSTKTVRRCLKALDELGHWTAGARGGPGRPTERLARFIHSAPPGGAENVGPPGGAELLGDCAPTDANCAPPDANCAPPGGATPRPTPSTPSSSPDADDEELIRRHFDQHAAFRGPAMDHPGAVRENALPRMRDEVARARRDGVDPLEALERWWRTSERPSTPVPAASTSNFSPGTGHLQDFSSADADEGEVFDPDMGKIQVQRARAELRRAKGDAA